jgi:hypothetical protein
MTRLPLSWVYELNRTLGQGHRMQSNTTCQSAAHKLLLGSVWSALGQAGRTGDVKDIAAALTPQLTRTLGNALDRVSQQLQSQGVNPAHVQTLVVRFNQELSDALDHAAVARGAHAR